MLASRRNSALVGIGLRDLAHDLGKARYAQKQKAGSFMIGVVVWSSESREKAIIWCEDQATLAYLQGRTNLAAGFVWPQPGDLVELESKTVGNLRHALNVSLVSEQSCLQLPTILAQAAEAPRSHHLRVVADSPVPDRPRHRAVFASMSVAG